MYSVNRVSTDSVSIERVSMYSVSIDRVSIYRVSIDRVSIYTVKRQSVNIQCQCTECQQTVSIYGMSTQCQYTENQHTVSIYRMSIDKVPTDRVSMYSVNRQSVNERLSIDRFHQSIQLEQISLHLYVSKQQVLTTVLHYNNFNIFPYDIKQLCCDSILALHTFLPFTTDML